MQYILLTRINDFFVLNLGPVNLSKVLYGTVLVRFWGTSGFSVPCPKFFPIFFLSPGYLLLILCLSGHNNSI